MIDKRCTREKRKKNVRYKVFQIRKDLEENNYRYQPTQEAVSYAEFVVHSFYSSQLHNGTELIGVRALREVVMFLKTYEKMFKENQSIALYLAFNVALRKVLGQRFTNANETSDIIQNVNDIKQAIRETLRASNIKTAVDTFISHCI